MVYTDIFLNLFSLTQAAAMDELEGHLFPIFNLVLEQDIAELVLAKSSSIADLDAGQLRLALGLRPDEMLTEDDDL